MALLATDKIKIEKADGSKAQTTAGDVSDAQTASQVKSKYESNANTNAFTDDEKTKLAGLDPNHFRGTFVSEAALNAVTGVAGDYGDVDSGTSNDVQRYIWDADDNIWVAQGAAVGSETAASIKTKYESNADTNAFTDGAKVKNDHLTVTAATDLDAIRNASHAAFSLGSDTGFSLAGQQLSNSYSALPAA